MQNGAQSPLANMDASRGADDEVARLEALLAARAAEVRALGEELARVRAILRDAVARPGVAPDGADDATLARAHEERDRAVARAVEAETACTEARFALDEANGRLAGAAAGREDGAHEAQLSGRERGLRARLAETVEERDTLEARAVLAEADLAESRLRVRGLERELAEVREQVGLAVAEAARQAPPATVQASLSAVRGELAGLRARSEEGEAAFESARVALARLRAEATAQREECERRFSDARAALADTRAALAELAGALRRVAARSPDGAIETTLVGVDAPASTRPPR